MVTGKAESQPGNRDASPWWIALRAALLGVLFVASISAILLLRTSKPQLDLNVGEVSSQDVEAPRHITYVSASETEKAQDRAEAAVRDVYDPPDAAVARQQVNRARQILDYISDVRADPYASPQEKTAWIEAIPDIHLAPEVVSRLLALEEKSWRQVKEETLYVLDQAMRSEIRKDQVAHTQERLPTLVRLDLSEEGAMITVALAEDLIIPNIFVNEARTEEARQQARESTPQQEITLEKGQTIIRAGDVVKEWQVEALQALGLRQPEPGWPPVVGTVVLVSSLAVLLGLFVARFRPRLWEEPRYLWLILLLIVLFTILARLMVPGRALLPYLFPLAALSMMLTVLVDTHLAIAVTIAMTPIVGGLSNNPLEFAAYVLIGGLVSALTLARVERVNAFLWTGTYVCLMNMAVILAFRVLNQNYDAIGLASLLLVSVANGALASGLTLVGFFILGNLFDITTSLQLLELARPDQPLLRQLLLKAPGTYHHSLMVANMSEQAAERIGANGLLARVGAYYHDIGKSVRPYFFVENTVEGQEERIHDQLDPYTSAQLIVGHVKDGLDLAKKYGLPRQVRAFIPEHQGTGTVKFFYHRARELAGEAEEVDEADFRYPGPRPQSRETAIVMLADSCEATVRANRPKSEEEIRETIHRTIMDKLMARELDDSDLTMRDLDGICEAFVDVLQGVFHPRIRYPEERKAMPAPDNPLQLAPPEAVPQPVAKASPE
jgi:putative nucleotidyltransferase with HDIG domain